MLHHSLMAFSPAWPAFVWADWTKRDVFLKYTFILFGVAAWAFVSVRIWIRSRLTKSMTADDLFLLATSLSYLAYILLGLESIKYGIGSEPKQVEDVGDLANASQFWFFAELFSVLTVTLLRITAAIYLRQAAKTVVLRRIILGVVAVMTVYNVLFFMVILFQCSPVEHFWAGWRGQNGSCLEASAMANIAYGISATGAVTDWTMALLPLWIFPEREMSSRTILSVRTLTVIGAAVGMAALLRIPGTMILVGSEDFFYDCVPIAMSVILESGLGIMALSAVPFHHLFPYLYAPGPTSEKFDETEKRTFHGRPHRAQKSRSFTDFVSLAGSGAQPFPNNAIVRRHSQDYRGVRRHSEH
ncbi:integral membrane protein [Phlyctema vagabunda]|uniref:Integral membrane protein n=1 Tax=Phlyctema vagabunda TaxID=108571 RepID=A0ABR4P8N8_9HELO